MTDETARREDMRAILIAVAKLAPPGAGASSIDIRRAITDIPDHQFNLTLHALIGHGFLHYTGSNYEMTTDGQEWLVEDTSDDGD